MATLRGKPVDRPAVCFYEINGLDEDPADPSVCNIYNDPSWGPLLDLARERTDRIVMRPVGGEPPILPPDLERVETRTEGDRRFTTRTIRAGNRTLTLRTRRDDAVNTIWTVEHLCKDANDLRAWIDLPDGPAGGPDVEAVLNAELRLGDTGIVMLDVPDPLCEVAALFEMGTYCVMASQEPDLFRRALDKAARRLQPMVEAVSRALPGRLWRIYGPEYATPPFLRPALFAEYVTAYDRPLVDAIHRHGGFARIHSHGRIRDVLDDIAATGCDGLDPIEPPPQGDVSLAHVRERHGGQLVLFGNLEISDIEKLPVASFERKIETALVEGTAGPGRGFVLMPSACPYGRTITPTTLANYRRMVELAERFGKGKEDL
jgi:hypothetical protein